jgi:hypothetical protein
VAEVLEEEVEGEEEEEEEEDVEGMLLLVSGAKFVVVFCIVDEIMFVFFAQIECVGE